LVEYGGYLQRSSSGGRMSITNCLAPANTIAYPNGGGHLWVYLQWALSLRALGCRVTWLEGGERHCRSACSLAEQYFDGRKVVARVLETAMK